MAYKQIRRRMKHEVAENDGATPQVSETHEVSQIQTDRELMTADDAMALQDLVGNRATGKIMGAATPPTPPRTGYVQPKPTPPNQDRHRERGHLSAYAKYRTPFVQPNLTVGAAHDPFEREADQVASQVVSQPAEVQREEQDDDMQLKPQIQRAGGDGSFETNNDFESKVNQQSGGGKPLPSDVRADLEPKFGADFSGVKVHTGSTAAQLSQDVGAQAFTHGSDIYFNQGKYNPESGAGKHLLAHELTHTVQQGAATVQQKPMAQQDIQRSDDQHGAGCKCAECGRVQRQADSSIQREADPHLTSQKPTAIHEVDAPSQTLQPDRHKRRDAIGPQEGEKIKFLMDLLQNEDTRSLTHNIPSTGMGRFDAEYVADSGQLIITVRPFFNYAGPWQLQERQEFEAAFIQQAQDKWSGQFAFVCNKPGWEDLKVTPVIRVNIANDMGDDPHFNLTVNHQKTGDTYIAREQYNDPTQINTGQFGRQDAPERPHDNLKTRCKLATHDVSRIEMFLESNGVKEVTFDPDGEIAADKIAPLAQAVQAINKTALPSAPPVPIIVTGYDMGTERGVFKKNKAKQRAAKVADAISGLNKNPVKIKTISQEIAEKEAEINNKLRLYTRAGDDSTGGYKRDGYWHKKDLDILNPMIASKNAQKVVIRADAEWASSYSESDPYSIIAHEFGHMLGNPDEYFGYGPELLDQKITQLTSSGDPIKAQEALELEKQRGKANINMNDEGRREIQGKFGTLVESAGQDIPDFTMGAGSSTTSIMNAGADILPAHYTPLWEALGRITAKATPSVPATAWDITTP